MSSKVRPVMIGTGADHPNAVVGCEWLLIDTTATDREGRSAGNAPPPPAAFIQWKGTDVCLDFDCPCGNPHSGHLDGDFVYALRCSECDRVFAMPSVVPLIEITDTAWHYATAKETERDDR